MVIWHSGLEESMHIDGVSCATVQIQSTFRRGPAWKSVQFPVCYSIFGFWYDQQYCMRGLSMCPCSTKSGPKGANAVGEEHRRERIQDLRRSLYDLYTDWIYIVIINYCTEFKNTFSFITWTYLTLIRVSLIEPHTSMASLHLCMGMLVCVLGQNRKF